MDGDVIVIGAGPAGSAAAIACLQSGLRILILDRASFLGIALENPLTRESRCLFVSSVSWIKLSAPHLHDTRAFGLELKKNGGLFRSAGTMKARGKGFSCGDRSLTAFF
jgi:2-polyprenyl-6-methoxyphenol hydroxylase-like FAD-dependent oxidoreductase